MAKRKDIPEVAKFTYLSNIIQLHINYHLILAQKNGFLVAVCALVLTLGFTEILNPKFVAYPLMFQIAITVASLGGVLSIFQLMSAEKTEPVKKVTTFHPLSLTEFHDEAKIKFNNDLRNMCRNEKGIVLDYSNQILHMKETTYRKTKKMWLATAMLFGSLFLGTFLAAVQIMIYVFPF
jgi:hypothetical protein